ncbi:ABC transporter permease [Brachymonas denitrificans]|jgi:peptide/nickel transport system permease protein|uniref:Peptide/nickel transport system permease protein n=1 Tax=Brachymonas denitrificans DSM 15123 TaxID=1121117 RepID=A0A1H8FAY5_9BURK|nr:ABC transporter permease [Brachymonas denitrificans]SEN28387.1 peptide/nickel transport system permease protein [Brachymonas denitrificans DSM 15123]
MGLYLAKRLLSLLLTLLFTSIVVFGVLEVLPGNAAQVMLGPDASPEAVAELSRQLGLHLPVHTRYLDWAGGLLQGDMGISHAYSSPVWPLIAERLALTIPLAVFAMLITSVLALVIGIYAASRHNKPADIAVMGISQIGMAVPNFWFAIVLILVFSVQLQWFSAGGFDGWRAGFWSGLQSLLLPAIALAVVQTAILARITRSSVLEVMQEDFVRTARARGLSERATLWRHVLRNAMIPVLTVMGLQFANLLAGTIVVENVFFLPGLGRLIFQSIANRDLVVVRNCVMLLAAMVIVVNFVVDVLYAAIDPRLRHREGSSQ